MSEENDRGLDNMLAAYENMFKRAAESIAIAGKAVSTGIFHAREKAVELDELTREEAEKVAVYLERDVHDIAEYLLETGEDLKQWFKFDVELVERRLYDMMMDVADKTRVEQAQLSERAKRDTRLHTGEMTLPGTLSCMACDTQMHFEKIGHIPPCPKCHGTEFKRSLDD